MTPESENFDQLKRLLALKRHEVPPPGYFNNFSRDVMARIRAGETASAPASTSWVQRILQVLEFRPAFAGACGLFICALLVGGMLYSAKMDEPVTAKIGNPDYPTLPLTAATTTPTTTTPLTMDSLSGMPSPSGLFNPTQLGGLVPAAAHPFGE